MADFERTRMENGKIDEGMLEDIKKAQEALAQERDMIAEIEQARNATITVGLSKVAIIERFLLKDITEESFKESVQRSNAAMDQLATLLEDRTRNLLAFQKEFAFQGEA